MNPESRENESSEKKKFEFIPLDLETEMELAMNEPLPDVLPIDDEEEEIEDIAEELENITEESDGYAIEKETSKEPVLDDTLGCYSIVTPIKSQVVYTSLPSETSKKIESKRLTNDFGINRLSLFTPVKKLETPNLHPIRTIKQSHNETDKVGNINTPQNCPKIKVVSYNIPQKKTDMFRTPIQPASLLKLREPATTSKISQGQLSETKFSKVIVRGTVYLILKVLGRGGSSEVYQCFDPFHKTNRAVKCVNLDSPSAMSFLKEVQVLGRLQGCDRIISVYDCEHLVEDKKLYVVMEMGSADLSQILKNLSSDENKISPPYLILFYWMEMLHAVSQLHKHAIIHSDLKPANFLLVNGRLKLIDFGISSCLQNDSTSVIKTVSEGSCNYISPEALNCEYSASVASPNYGKPKYKISYKSDVWSLGCILYQLVYRRTPFQHITHPMKKLMAIADPKMAIEYPQLCGVPEKFINTIKKCLIFDVKTRASVAELIAEYEQFDKV